MDLNEQTSFSVSGETWDVSELSKADAIEISNTEETEDTTPPVNKKIKPELQAAAQSRLINFWTVCTRRYLSARKRVQLLKRSYNGTRQYHQP